MKRKKDWIEYFMLRFIVKFDILMNYMLISGDKHVVILLNFSHGTFHALITSFIFKTYIYWILRWMYTLSSSARFFYLFYLSRDHRDRKDRGSTEAISLCLKRVTFWAGPVAVYPFSTIFHRSRVCCASAVRRFHSMSCFHSPSCGTRALSSQSVWAIK